MSKDKIKIGGLFRKKKILDLVKLSNGWIIIKTENSKSEKDFKVRTIYQLHPRIRFFTPKHAHFAIDLYGKLCANREGALNVFEAIIDVWNRKPVHDVLKKYSSIVSNLPGYNLEYILYALNWILEQEDINFKGRPEKKQKELDEILKKLNIRVPPDRLGSELAISLLCNIIHGLHPVEALLKANLDVLPRKRARGAI
ncbi:MAG: hypothetical protein ACP6IS_11025 [Candidatus Asgardarchaeia archaeon]